MNEAMCCEEPNINENDMENLFWYFDFPVPGCRKLCQRGEGGGGLFKQAECPLFVHPPCWECDEPGAEQYVERGDNNCLAPFFNRKVRLCFLCFPGDGCKKIKECAEG